MLFFFITINLLLLHFQYVSIFPCIFLFKSMSRILEVPTYAQGPAQSMPKLLQQSYFIILCGINILCLFFY